MKCQKEEYKNKSTRLSKQNARNDKLSFVNNINQQQETYQEFKQEMSMTNNFRLESTTSLNIINNLNCINNVAYSDYNNNA